MISKRGISPLIASVLLIAFVIALFVLVSSFVTKTSEEAMEGTEGKVASTVKCTATVIDVSYACDSGTGVKLDIDNSANTEIVGLKVRVVGDAEADTEDYSLVDPAGASDRIVSRGDKSFDYEAALGTLIRIEVIPEIEEGFCGGSIETVEVEDIGECS